MSTPEQQQRLAQLNAAIHSGERTITDAKGASVTYRSLDEMMAARRDLEAQMAPVGARRRAVVARATFTTLRGG
ncbi:MAG: phage head-tail joining protein [Giesbergeria sp.]